MKGGQACNPSHPAAGFLRSFFKNKEKKSEKKDMQMMGRGASGDVQLHVIYSRTDGKTSCDNVTQFIFRHF